MAVAPSGQQFEIRSGDTVATVVEVGGALRDLRVGDRPLIDGYPVGAVCDGARGQSLLPWPNRVKDGRYIWLGEEQQLALSEPGQGCAIHGLARWSNWRCADHGEDSVVMTYRLPPQTGWLWTLDLELRYSLDAGGVTVTTSATNRSDTVAPFAAGAHPYLRASAGRIDEATLDVPAASYLPTGAQQIPTGVEPVDRTPYDFHQPKPIGDTVIDYAYTGLQRDADGLFRARLTGEWTAEVWLDAAYPYLEVFTGDTLAAEHRRTGVGVEPMTGPPNALGSNTDVISLEPGTTWTGTWGIRLGELRPACLPGT